MIIGVVRQLVDYVCIRRLEAGVSQRQLRRLTGIAQATISQYESYHFPLPLLALYRISQALDLRLTLVAWRGHCIDRLFELGSPPAADAPRLVTVPIAATPAATSAARAYATMPWKVAPLRVLPPSDRASVRNALGLHQAA